jgi:hypothetical protein
LSLSTKIGFDLNQGTTCLALNVVLLAAMKKPVRLALSVRFPWQQTSRYCRIDAQADFSFHSHLAMLRTYRDQDQAKNYPRPGNNFEL